MRILLWDVDGTLVNAGGAGRRALAQTVAAALPAVEALRTLRLDGMTDRRIARMLCAAVGCAQDPSRTIDEHLAAVAEAEIDRVLGGYLDALALHMREPGSWKVLPGVVRTLDALDGRGDCVHALATGNVERGARTKLEGAGLWSRFRFGGFGSDAEERALIVRVAWLRAEAHLGRACDASEIVVVGDTPRDVSAAHEAGVACVAVASGRHAAQELARAGADAVLATLDCDEAAAVIAGAARN